MGFDRLVRHHALQQRTTHDPSRRVARKGLHDMEFRGQLRARKAPAAMSFEFLDFQRGAKDNEREHILAHLPRRPSDDCCFDDEGMLAKCAFDFLGRY
jgi:hypothetical protein